MGSGAVTGLLARSGRAPAQPAEHACTFARWYDGAKYVDETGQYQRGADGSNGDGQRTRCGAPSEPWSSRKTDRSSSGRRPWRTALGGEAFDAAAAELRELRLY